MLLLRAVVVVEMLVETLVLAAVPVEQVDL
jgi:hypothetical protein